MAQNVLATVDFDGNFVYVLAGWEGAAHDNIVLRGALSRFNFSVPPGRFYLADSGYANTRNFITPYRNHLYHLSAFRRRSRANRYLSSEDLFNHRHAQLRNIVERTFGVVKKKFKILEFMRTYDYKRQCKIVIACCILHNFIRKHTEVPTIMRSIDTTEEEDEDSDEEDEVVAADPIIAASIVVDATEIGANIRQDIRDWFWSHRET
jgi:DDE superfamily endonuclease